MELIEKSIIVYILINVLCKNVITKCPTNKPLANCFVNPCKVSTCMKYPSAKCIPDYCGGCYAIWIYRNKIIKTCQDEERKTLEKPKCPASKPLVNCLVDPCQVSKCSRYPKASCKSNYCGTCKAEWFYKGKKVKNCNKKKT